MAKYSSGTLIDWVRPPVTAATYISPNYISGADPRYAPVATVQDYSGTGGVLTRRPRQRTTHRYPSLAAGSWSEYFYYRYRYFYSDVEILTSLSLGAVSSEKNIIINVFSGYKEKNLVTSITTPSGAGLTVTNLSVGDRVQPYSEYPLAINVAKEGDINVFGDIVVTFGNGRSWTISLSLTRVTVPLVLLDANWNEDVSLSRAFLTNIFSAATMSETRKALRKVPVRTHTASLTFRNKESALRAWSLARTMVSDFFYFPLFVDETRMTATNAGYRIYCDVSYRRFEAGQYVLLRHRVTTGDPKGDIMGHQILTIDTVESDGLTLSGDTPEAYDVGDRVYPLMKCLPNTSSVAQAAFTKQIGTLDVSAVESWGPDSLALENSGYTPTELAGLPVFDYRVNEAQGVELVVMHGGGTSNAGRGFEVTQYGQAYQSQSYTVVAESRAIYWDMIGFFNYIKGRAKAFWVKQHLDLFSLDSQVGDVYVFESDLEAADLDTLEYLWVSDAAGNEDIVEVLGIADTAAGFDISCSASAIVSSATTAWQALAVRQSSDEVTENWLTLSVVELSFTVEEVQGMYTS